jgi:hypothetical protein
MRVYEENIDEKGETVDKVKEARGHHTVKKKVHEFPVSSRDVNQTPPGQE